LLTLLAVTALCAAGLAGGSGGATPTRVTVIGDSVATGIAYNASARAVLAAGVDLDLEAAVCRRLAGDSCPYDGVRPPTLVDLLPTLRLGSTVVVAVGYNDYEDTFAATIETVLDAVDKTGVDHILWLTLRGERQSYLNMNDLVRAAAARHPELTVVDWNLYSRSHPDWFQPDGLHLTDVGAVAMATLVHRSLDDLGLVAPPPVRALAIVTKALPKARVGRLYVARLTASGGTSPIRWGRAAGTIPTGLTLRRDGRLTGTPRSAGRRNFSVRATDASGRSVTRRLAIAISP
jgi:hypothetical protein